ncbi:hypothetical protein B0H14DRAFT_2594500 [Mycena olivaceomarginata]|nr:hypothetical protein B0H14DRAFT_2594500 [Mycena olivaceomarginata]
MGQKGNGKGGNEPVAKGKSVGAEESAHPPLVPSHERRMEGQTAASFSHTASTDAPPSAPIAAPSTAETEDAGDQTEDDDPSKKSMPLSRNRSSTGNAVAAKKPRKGSTEYVRQAYEEKQAEMSAYVETLVKLINDATQKAEDAAEEIDGLKDRIETLEGDIAHLRGERARGRGDPDDTGSDSSSDSGLSDGSSWVRTFGSAQLTALPRGFWPYDLPY